MNLFYKKIPASVIEVLDRIEEAGHEAYIVGGCVRDMLLGKEPKDWDICTSALPQEVVQIFGQERVHPTGLKHGTVTVVLEEGTGYEVTTYRVDGAYGDGRHPDSVTFTKKIENDLARRDFTINAMAYNPKTGLKDPFFGKTALTNRLICCVGDPVARFEEDSLRILRGLRFSSQLGFAIEDNTRNAMYHVMNNMKALSNERIGKEVYGIVTGCYAADVIEENKALFFAVVPLLQAIDGCAQNNQYHCGTVFDHTMNAMRNAYTCHEFPDEWADEYVKFSLLFHDIGKPVSKMTDALGHDHFYGHPARSAELTTNALIQLRYSNKFRETVVELVENHAVEFTPSKNCARRLLNKFGEEQVKRLLKLRECDNRAHSHLAYPRFEKSLGFRKCLNEVIAENSAFSLKQLAVNGKDLMANGFEPGPEMGAILKKLLNEVMEGCPNEKDVLLQKAKEFSRQPTASPELSLRVLETDGTETVLRLKDILEQNGIDMSAVSELGIVLENEAAKLTGTVCPQNGDGNGLYLFGQCADKEVPLADIGFSDDAAFVARLYPGAGDAPVAEIKTPVNAGEIGKAEVKVDTKAATVRPMQKF